MPMSDKRTGGTETGSHTREGLREVASEEDSAVTGSEQATESEAACQPS